MVTALDALRQLRAEGLSFKSIGRRVGLSHELVRLYLLGRRVPTADSTSKIAAAFGRR